MKRKNYYSVHKNKKPKKNTLSVNWYPVVNLIVKANELVTGLIKMSKATRAMSKKINELKTINNPTNMNELIQMSQGNPGAMNFLMELAKPQNIEKGISIILKLKQMPSIKGTNLYVLYSDICNKDLDKVAALCENCPREILEDACSRQDYSGREMVKEYFTN